VQKGKTESRKQKAESRKQKAENRKQKTKSRKQRAEIRKEKNYESKCEGRVSSEGRRRKKGIGRYASLHAAALAAVHYLYAACRSPYNHIQVHSHGGHFDCL